MPVTPVRDRRRRWLGVYPGIRQRNQYGHVEPDVLAAALRVDDPLVASGHERR